MKGRKPKLNVLHLASGSQNFRPNEPKPTTALGDPPPILKGLALETWNMAVIEMEKIRVGSRIDSEALTCYCLAVQMVADATEEIRKNGLTVCTERGWTKNPACSILNSAMTQVKQFASEFGFTPVSRARVTTARPADEKSPWEEMKRNRA